MGLDVESTLLGLRVFPAVCLCLDCRQYRGFFSWLLTSGDPQAFGKFRGIAWIAGARLTMRGADAAIAAVSGVVEPAKVTLSGCSEPGPQRGSRCFVRHIPGIKGKGNGSKTYQHFHA